MGKYVLYSHAGSENHGCEALLRTTVMTMGDVDCAFSGNVGADEQYGLSNVVALREDKTDLPQNGIRHLMYSLKYKLTKDDKLYFKEIYRKMLDQVEQDKVYVSIGGDNYCYHFSEWLEVLNAEINKKGAKTILWGCSINADELENQAVVNDLKKYSMITARESLTFELLKEKLPGTNVKYVPDTAFVLPTREVKLPSGFVEGNTVGINLSPVILNSAKNGDELVKGFVALVDYIIQTTNYQIALIPHVVITGNDDRVVLKEIYDRCSDQRRLVMIEDANCMELKGYISKCSLFIGARTHSTIAAYSTLVPTLVIGYSVKSLGIAKDLFGQHEKYVLPVQSIKNPDELIEHFLWLDQNKVEIKQRLESIMPEYVSRIKKVEKYLEEV